MNQRFCKGKFGGGNGSLADINDFRLGDGGVVRTHKRRQRKTLFAFICSAESSKFHILFVRHFGGWIPVLIWCWPTPICPGWCWWDGSIYFISRFCSTIVKVIYARVSSVRRLWNSIVPKLFQPRVGGHAVFNSFKLFRSNRSHTQFTATLDNFWATRCSSIGLKFHFLACALSYTRVPCNVWIQTTYTYLHE